MRAEEIIELHFAKGIPLDECWKRVNPKATAKPKSAEVLARREISWFCRRYPKEFERRLRRARKQTRKRLGIEDSFAAPPTTGPAAGRRHPSAAR